MTEVWTKWESLVISGVFPLRRFLSASDHSVVFLTEHKAQNFPNAAIKLVPADPALAEAQLSHWRMAATLSHPHLIRLFDAGHCQLGGHPFLFVVMEYAEETLSQILPQRALTPDEAREMLLPTLDALAFLHRKNLVQGQLKPPNFLVVNDQLKLASDTIRPAGEPTASIAKSSLYDPPEAKSGRISAAGDIWGLGITLVEALTQCPPAWSDERSETVSLPATLPSTFVEIVRQCLNRNPANRPTVADLEARIKPAPQAQVVSVPPVSLPQPPVSVSQPPVAIPEPLVQEVPSRATPPQQSPKQRSFIPAIAALLMILAVVWAGLRLFGSQTSSQQATAPAAASQSPQTSMSAPPGGSAPLSSAKSAQSKSAPSRAVSRPSNLPAQPLADASPSVLHEEIPRVPRSARNTIHGQIKVAVRVIVDTSGNVVGETLENSGSSKYFARLATRAAKKWKFAPTDNHGSREWLLRFEFTRGGTTGHAAVSRKR
jgi:TonB family protein